VRGYAVTNGNDAWIVYYGYKLQYPPNATELSIAGRCADSVVPHTGEAHAEQPGVAAGKGGGEKKG